MDKLQQPRVHFLDEQRRHRRTSTASALLVVVVLAVSGIPLSVVVSPLLVAATAVPVYLADLVLDVPQEVTGWFDRVFHLLPTAWSAVRRGDVDLPWDLLAALFVVPGFVVMLLLWALVRLTFRGTGVGGVLRRTGIRHPSRRPCRAKAGQPGGGGGGGRRGAAAARAADRHAERQRGRGWPRHG